MIVIGLGGLRNDAACALLKNGEILAAVEESKVTRGQRPPGLPQNSIEECLRLSGATRDQVDCVAIVRPVSRGPEAELHLTLRDLFPHAEVVVVEHHMAHAASAFFASPFEEATVLTLDHAGDFRCGARWRALTTAGGAQIELEKEWYFPDSLGRLYGAVTELL
jgi:carbamoyltransferase